MYESFYGLKEKPFTLLPDPDYLYLSPKHQRALTLLEYGIISQAGFSVICGDAGAGKTTLLRRLLIGLGDDTSVGLITNTHQSFGELLNWVLMAFGLDGEDKSKPQMHKIFINFLINQYAQNKRTILIVDEAQNMRADTLEELRMLSNINADKDQVLQVILAGQPALRETLRKPELQQFAQRISVDYYLEALNEEETRAYIHHRLKIAGTETQVFTDHACRAIYRYSNGIPRLINLLCDTSMVYGYAEQLKSIDEALVHEVVREQHNSSIIPTFNTSQSHPTDSLPPVTAQSSQAKLLETVNSGVRQNDVSVEDTYVEQQDDSMIAELAQRAVQAVMKSERTATVIKQTNKVTSSSKGIIKNENNVSNTNEIKSDVSAANSNVTPIKIKKTETGSETQISQMDFARPAGKSALTSEVDESEVREPPILATSQGNERKIAEAIRAENTVKHMIKNDVIEDAAYPVVHIEDNSKKSLIIMIIGLVAGIFIATMVMMALAWVLFGSKDIFVPQEVQQIEKDQEFQRDIERRQFEVLQKERDAALVESRALQRERDAALATAKAQEDIRTIEVKAAKVLAAQKQKAEEKLRQLTARAKKAELSEAKAIERERLLQLQEKKREAAQEAQYLQALSAERQRQEALTEELRRKEVLAEQQAQLKAQAEVEEEALAQVEAQVMAEKEALETSQQQVESEATEIDDSIDVEVPVKNTEHLKTFSANPCNSPSAKFLSTCKK